MSARADIFVNVATCKAPECLLRGLMRTVVWPKYPASARRRIDAFADAIKKAACDSNGLSFHGL